jgi:acetolactate synthase I/II/III large subunit
MDAETGERLDGGEALLEAFRRLGVDYIVSSPGSEWAPIWEAVARQKQKGINGPGFLDCWHETLAVDIATGYTLATGRMQAVLIHAGAGLLQGSMGVHGALQAEVPMLVMSGESLGYGYDPAFDPGSQWIRNLSVVGGPHRLIEPLVKFSQQVTSPHTLYDMVVRTGEMAQRQPKGPTFLNIPFETMLHEWRRPTAQREVPTAPITLTPPEDIRRLAEMLVRAEHPVLTTDAVGRDPEAYTALIELAELLALPVLEGRGSLFANFPKTNPLHQGFAIKPFLDEMDLALLVRSRVPWYPPQDRPAKATVVCLDETPHREHMVVQALHADRYLEGDVARTLSDLTSEVKRLGVDKAKVEARRKTLTDRHARRAQATAEAIAKAKANPKIDPVWLCAALGEVMPADTVYLDEVTTHSNALRDYIPYNRPQTFFCRQGGLGQGLGLSLGLKLAMPARPVVALVGDGSFLYNPALQALGASRDYNLPILAVVFNNSKYAAMQGNTRRFYPGGSATSTDTYFGVHINGPDYAEIAKLYGGHGERVEDPARLKGAIADALAAVNAGRTAILNVIVSE